MVYKTKKLITQKQINNKILNLRRGFMSLPSVLNAYHIHQGSYSNLGKTHFLSYDTKENSWNVLELNLWDRIARYVFGAYQSTHFNTVYEGLLKEKRVSEISDLDEFLQHLNKTTYQRLIDKGHTIESSNEEGPVLFKGKIKKSNFLSNLFPTLVHYKDEIDDRIYPSTEVAYQAVKFKDKELRMRIASIQDPWQAMREAKSIENKDNVIDGWNEGFKEIVMIQLLRAKFNQNNDIQRRLLETGTRDLIEHTDNKYWGDGTPDGIIIGDGLNRLGHLLMQVRQELADKNI